QRGRLLAEGIAARAAAFTSSDPGGDAVRMAAELDCDLLLLDAPPELLESPILSAILAGAPCDVAALIGDEPAPGPVLVPFVGAGLSDRWHKEGLGPTRGALTASATPPTLLVRRGLRPGGLAPRESLTRFTWSLRPGSA